MLHRIYFAPGMFGFGRLASYDYFVHLERALVLRLRAAGDDAETHVLNMPPTASLRRRAAKMVACVAETSGTDNGPIHLVGHSTGGLDARLVASPSALLPVAPADRTWLPRLASVSTLNTPHYGTPLASFFATVSGQRMLYALSAMTFIALSVGAPPLGIASAIAMSMPRLDRMIGVELRVLDDLTERLLRVLDDARSREVREYLSAIKEDQAALIQLTPEAMDLFQAGIEDRPGVVYQSAAAMAPPPTPLGWARTIGRPWATLSATLFTTLHGITSRYDARYPCAAQDLGQATEAKLVRTFGRSPGVRANDGVVPLRSQIWGDLVWVGYADHLDVLGHFKDDRPRAEPHEAHVDWLTSGAAFDRTQFERLASAMAEGMCAGAARNGS
jgi:hypothetical protein